MNATTPDRYNSLLIIFYRNPEIGKVKTRLAATLGDSSALAIYLYLTAHTKSITENLTVDKAVYYSNHIDTEDNWQNTSYKKYIQTGADLGERMANAFMQGFQSGYRSICIIGTDCFELTSGIIDEAFIRLRSHDTVVGPAKDGGYYLLGLNTYHAELFTNKLWSTHSVCADTIQDIVTLGLKYHELPALTDVDEEKDLPDELRGLL
jgi:uncharacterized protein